MWMKILTVILSGAIGAGPASAFCGFYVAQADADLFNNSSKVVVARKDQRTVVTMANDYEGDLTEFAMVVPVPTLITREQVHISDPDLIKTLDAFSAPRLAEYYDDDPCYEPPVYSGGACAGDLCDLQSIVVTGSRIKDAALGVTIEDSFTAGEYDILILSATQSNGLQTWLNENGYILPEGANRILGSYIRQGMKFFVAKINLEERDKTGSDFLRPISIAYEDENFMLPIRLGTLNANGSQDLIAFFLTSKGRVETSNYRTSKIPTNKDVPLFIKEEADAFGGFYKAVFDRAVEKRGGSGVFLEYFWDVGSCDPCAGAPPSLHQLARLGAFWMDDVGIEDLGDLTEEELSKNLAEQAMDTYGDFEDLWRWSDQDFKVFKSDLDDSFDSYWGDNLFLTRLHVRYDARSFPEDLTFIETGDKRQFQGRYVINVPWRGEATCEAAESYISDVTKRQTKEFKALRRLTNWDMDTIRARATANGDLPFTLATKPAENTDSPEKARARAYFEAQRESLKQSYWWLDPWRPSEPED